MIVKQSPDDFRVEELTSVTTNQEGPFAFYQLEKRGWTTQEAMKIVRDRWRCTPNQLSFGGLKDRHAHTTQHFTVLHGPKKNLQHDTFSVTYLGQVSTPFESTDIQANRFTITVRGLTEQEVQRVTSKLADLQQYLLPNYFDDQRFGSVAQGKFIAREMVVGNFEEALQLALSAPYEFDRQKEKRAKQLLRKHWGDWSKCSATVLSRSAKQVLKHLLRFPTDFQGACERLPAELLVLYLHAWQSHLWNRLLDRWIRAHSSNSPTSGLELKTGSFALPTTLRTEELEHWKTLELPLPSARLKLETDASWSALLNDVMTEEGVPLDEMLIKGMRKPFFSKGFRQASFAVSGLQSSFATDERNLGKQKLQLQFELSRGCYATIVLKCLGAQAEVSDASHEE